MSSTELNTTERASSHPSGEAGRFATDEAVAWEVAVRPWDLLVDYRMAKGFAGKIHYLRVPGITLYRDEYKYEARLQGALPPNTFTIGIPINPNDDSRLWSKKANSNTVYTALPGPFYERIAAGQGHLVALVDFNRIDGCRLMNVVDRAPSTLPFEATSHSPVSIRTGARYLQRILDASLRHPEVLDNKASLSSIIDDLTECLDRLACSSVDASGLTNQRGASLQLKRALDYVHCVDPFYLTVSELCAGAGVHERTLERAMRGSLGCTVREFLRRRRLHIARRLLLGAELHATKVTTVAFDLGFYDLGRFASDYRKLFGEKPSETLKHKRQYIDEVLGAKLQPNCA